jgi:hypothetical protein
MSIGGGSFFATGRVGFEGRTDGVEAGLGGGVYVGVCDAVPVAVGSTVVGGENVGVTGAETAGAGFGRSAGTAAAPLSARGPGTARVTSTAGSRTTGTVRGVGALPAGEGAAHLPAEMPTAPASRHIAMDRATVITAS